jgi:tetratricopeptide (TPR) repeat protein
MMMKNYASSILVLFIAAAFMCGFVGCEKLKISNLQANYHLKKANRLYMDESYKKATEEYELALKANPNLKTAYLYLGTSYSALYRPMKTDDRNKEYGEKAAEYLLKAYEAFPENENIVYALGDIYDKMGQFEEAEKYYLKILEKAKEKAEETSEYDPKPYYILADFYSKYSRTNEAKAMYQERISLDPTAPDGYLYYASYASDRRLWDLSIENHEKRILAIYDPDTLKLQLEIEKMKKDIEQIEGIKKNMETIKKHRSLDKAEKTRLLDEATQRLEKFQPLEELTKLVPEKEKQVEENLKAKNEKIDALTDEKKKVLVDALYTLGVVCWNKSFQSPPHIMGPKERIQTVDKGLDACNAALRLKPDHYNAYAFIGLLWRQKIIAEPLKNDEYMANWKKAYDKAKSLRDRQVQREKLQKQLEQMGKAAE